MIDATTRYVPISSELDQAVVSELRTLIEDSDLERRIVDALLVEVSDAVKQNQLHLRQGWQLVAQFLSKCKFPGAIEGSSSIAAITAIDPPFIRASKIQSWRATMPKVENLELTAREIQEQCFWLNAAIVCCRKSLARVYPTPPKFPWSLGGTALCAITAALCLLLYTGLSVLRNTWHPSLWFTHD